MVKAKDSEILEVIVAVIKKLVDDLTGLVDEVCVRVDVADSFDDLLQNALAKMHGLIKMSLLEERLVQYLSYF